MAVAGAILAVSGSPAAATELPPPAEAPNAVSPQEIDAYRERFSVSPDEARTHLETQHAGFGIVRLLENEEGRRYAGVWFDPDTGDFVVPVLPGADEGAVEETLVRAHLGGNYRLAPADASWMQLEAAQKRLTSALRPQIEASTVQTSLDPRTNAVVVAEAKTAHADQGEIARLAEESEVKIEVRPRPFDEFNSEPMAACKRWYTEFWACDRPARGGPIIVNSEGEPGGSCSMGFKAVGNTFGNEFMLTAGHCWNHINPSYQIINWAGRDSENFQHYLGFVGAGAGNYPGHDYAAIRVNGYGKYYEEGAWPSIVAASFEVNEAAPISYESSSFLNQTVCHSGARSGASCGVVTAIDLIETYKNEAEESVGTVEHLTKAEGGSLCSIPGDSGGPVFSGETALGLLSGAGSKAACGGNYMLYQEITEATRLLEVTVGTKAGALPAVQTYPATNLQPYQATANSKVDPNGLATTYAFDYGLTTSYGASTAAGSAGSGFDTTAQSSSITGLDPATGYHFRVRATNSLGTVYGEDGFFITSKVKPIVSTAPATEVKSASATLNGSVNTGNISGTYWFEYGASAGSYPFKTEVKSLNSKTLTPVNAKLSGLTFGDSVHYRIAANNELGTVYGSNQVFTPGWRTVANPQPSGAKWDQLTAVSCLSATQCMGVGSYRNSSGVEVTLAEQWNGSSWEILPTENPSTASSSILEGVSCTSPTHCMAVGFYHDGATNKYLPMAERWNGTEWELLTSTKSEGSRSYLYDVSCSSSTSCMAVGFYQTEEPEYSKTFAEYWNGSSWELKPPLNPETVGGEPSAEDNVLRSVSCVSSTDCKTVGWHLSSVKGSTQYESLAQHWNGASWVVKNTPAVAGKSDSWLEGISCSAANACTTVGYASAGHHDESIQQSLAMRWNGTSWSIQTTPNTEGGGRTYLYGVSCTSSTFCMAVGNGVTLRWNGSKWDWQLLPVPGGAYSLYPRAVGCYSSISCMAVGSYESASKYIGALSESYQKTLPPTPITKAATTISELEATLKGTVNPNGSEAKYWFEYGPTTSYGTKTTEASAGSGSNPVEQSKTLSGLEPAQKYHFRIVASSAEGVANGKDEVFETSPPTASHLGSMKTTDPFNETTSAVSNFGSNWAALGWAGGTVPKGLNRTTGWGPSNAYSTVNGAFFQPIVTDVGSGVANQVTMSTNPGNVGRYFSLWLDMPTPGSTRAGYELRFTNTATNTYTVALSRWKEGSQTALATKEGYSFVNGNSLALLDQGGTVSAWTNTGAGFAQLLSASDSTFSSGNSGVEGSGNITRLTNFKVGSLLKSASNMDGALKALPVNDAFSTNESPLSGGGAWAALQWANGFSGHNTGWVEGGWGPYDPLGFINGAYWQKASFADTGSGAGVAAVLSTKPIYITEYFSLWLNAPSPATARSGYELRITREFTGNFEVGLYKWVAGTKTTLAAKTGVALATGNKFAFADKAGTVSAWVNTGSEYTQLLSASDSTYTSGYTGIEGYGNLTRLKEFRSGPLAPF